MKNYISERPPVRTRQSDSHNYQQPQKPPSYLNFQSEKPSHIMAPPTRPRKQKRDSSRGKNNSQVSGRMLHYQDYLRKRHQDGLKRKRSQKRIGTENRQSRAEREPKEGEKVYRSRVSSAEVHANRGAQHYSEVCGYKPLWWG